MLVSNIAPFIRSLLYDMIFYFACHTTELLCTTPRVCGLDVSRADRERLVVVLYQLIAMSPPKPASYATVAAAAPPSTGHAAPTAGASVAIKKRNTTGAEPTKPVWSLEENTPEQADQVPLGMSPFCPRLYK